MSDKRVRELRQIAAHLYADMLDKMITYQFGYILEEEETIVLAELAKKVNLDLAQWIVGDKNGGE
jgi:hypothetical protein